MSIRTNKMKAVPVLLKQLRTTRRKFHERGIDESFDRKLEKLRLDLKKIEDVFVRVKKKEEELLDTLAEVYGHLRKLDRGKLDEDMDEICKRIRDSTRKLLPTLVFDDSSKDEDPKGGEIFRLPEEFVQLQQKNWTLKHYYSLGLPSRFCLLSLLIFPENAAIRKRNAVSLWIGEGLVGNTENKTAEKLVEDVIHNLFNFGMIVRLGDRTGPLVNKFQIHPAVRRQLKIYLNEAFEYIRPPWRLQLHGKKVTVGGVDTKNVTLRTVFNIGASYLNFRPQWVAELKNLEVLQLGRWQDSALHHIEVGSEEFLKELRYLKKLKCLSLRGISRIFELPSSIAELENLQILDLN